MSAAVPRASLELHRNHAGVLTNGALLRALAPLHPPHPDTGYAERCDHEPQQAHEHAVGKTEHRHGTEVKLIQPSRQRATGALPRRRLESQECTALSVEPNGRGGVTVGDIE